MNSTLISDATTFVGRMDRNQRRIAKMNILLNNAEAAGATVSDDPNVVNGLTSCCFQSEPVDFDAIKLMLMCKLGVHKDYPQ